MPLSEVPGLRLGCGGWGTVVAGARVAVAMSACNLRIAMCALRITIWRPLCGMRGVTEGEASVPVVWKCSRPREEEERGGRIGPTN